MGIASSSLSALPITRDRQNLCEDWYLSSMAARAVLLYCIDLAVIFPDERGDGVVHEDEWQAAGSNAGRLSFIEGRVPKPKINNSSLLSWQRTFTFGVGKVLQAWLLCTLSRPLTYHELHSRQVIDLPAALVPSLLGE